MPMSEEMTNDLLEKIMSAKSVDEAKSVLSEGNYEFAHMGGEGKEGDGEAALVVGIDAGPPVPPADAEPPGKPAGGPPSFKSLRHDMADKMGAK